MKYVLKIYINCREHFYLYKYNLIKKMKDDLKLIGILSERDMDGRMPLKELRKIIFDCL